jgi:hypothetical protein
MKLVHAIVLAIMLTFSTIASAAPASGCCPDDMCDIVQCVAMGCAPSIQAIAAPTFPAPLITSQAETLPVEVQRAIVPVFEEIWAPPD